MPPLRQQRIAARPRRGKSVRTQQSSVREVRLLAPFYHTSPARISAQELQRYVLPRKNVDGLAPTSRRSCYRGMRFCYPHVLHRAWATLALRRAPTTPHLPEQPSARTRAMGQRPTRSRSGFRRGRLVILAALCRGQPLPGGYRLPARWPSSYEPGHNRFRACPPLPKVAEKKSLHWKGQPIPQ